MYASQTKRLCVREAPTDDNRAQHHSSSSSADTTTEPLQQQQQQSSSSPLTPTTSATSPSSLNTGITTRPESKTSLANIGSSSASASPHFSNSGNIVPTVLDNSSMTASAAGNLSGNENESPVKTSNNNNQTSPVIHPTHQDHLQMSEQQQQYKPPEEERAKHHHQEDDKEHKFTKASEQHLINRLANETLEEARLELILSIRNLLTACNKKKVSLVNNPNFVKIVQMIDDERHTSPEVKAQLALLLCSVAKGGEHNVKVLNDSSVDDKIFNLMLGFQDHALVEACLRCMRAIMSWPKVSRHCMLYDKHPSTNHQQNPAPKRIIDYARTSNSYIVQECVADIFAATCNRSKDQALLCNSGALQCIVQLLESKSHRVILAALNWLSTMCFMNPSVSIEAVNSQCPSGAKLLDRLVELMRKDECIELQFSAAKCFTRIYKVLQPSDHTGNNFPPYDSRIVTCVLPTLVRMVHEEKPTELRSEAAFAIASLIESDTKLQDIASICDHLIDSLAQMLEYDTGLLADIRKHYSHLMTCDDSNDRDIPRWPVLSRYESPQLLDLSSMDSKQSESSEDAIYSERIHEMKRAAFQALAALASNQETIRKKIFDSCAIMQHLVKGLSDTDSRTLKSVLVCLLSLSRSVQQLRTSFAESTIYSGLKNLLLTKSNDILNLVLMILCNISLDFSPGKQHFLDSPTIEILCKLTKDSDPSLRLHSMWILMNMVYMLQDLDLKMQILKTITPDYVLSILDNETYEMLVLKTLGFLRNLLSYRPHIDAIMSSYGDQIMRSLVKVLDRSCSADIKEQAICVLTNIADGRDAKAMIMNNRTLLKYLASTLCDDNAGGIRLAAICCITNLAHKDQEGCQIRQNEMKTLGIQDRLKSMLNTTDATLSDRVRTAYNQFLLGIDDKYVN